MIHHTGVVSENMQGLGAKLRKLPGQAKICTPLGGEVIAKICVLRHIPFSPLSPPSGGGYVSHREIVAAAIKFGFLLLLFLLLFLFLLLLLVALL